MYMFSRQAELAPGHYVDGMEWAAKVTEKVNQVTGMNISLWGNLFSPKVSTLTWVCPTEHLTDLDDSMSKLFVDNTYLDLVQQGRDKVIAPPNDRLAQLVYGDIDPSRRPSYAAVVESTMANGSFQRAIEVGVEIAQRATAAGGLPTAFYIGTTGTYGGCVWVTTADTLSELETAQQNVDTNPDFIKFLDTEAAPCYLSGSTTQILARRLI